MENFENQLTFTRFYEICKKYSDHTALVYLGQKFTFGYFETLVDKFATGLLNLGVKKGDKVMLYISNCPQWLIANYAINRIGAVTVPVSPIYTTFEIEYMIRDAGIESVICLDTKGCCEPLVFVAAAFPGRAGAPVGVRPGTGLEMCGRDRV